MTKMDGRPDLSQPLRIETDVDNVKRVSCEGTPSRADGTCPWGM